MQWNVLYHNVNTHNIDEYNIFKHGGFNTDVEKLLKKDLSKDEFALQLKRSLMYYFWSKAEWEVVITSLTPDITPDELDRLNREYEEYNKKWEHYPLVVDVNLSIAKKVDVYQQVMLNWQVFVDYVWEHKEVVS